MSKTRLLIIPLFVAICLTASAGPHNVEQDGRFYRAMIKPSLLRLEPGRQQQFKIIYQATYLMNSTNPEKVKWSVNNIKGGNKKLGTIDENGLYTAPNKIPKPCEIHICAEVKEAVNKKLFGTVLMCKGQPEYKLIHTWSEPNDNPKYLKSPHGIGLDKKGNILIADQGNNRVMRFTKKGEYLGDIGTGKGSKPGETTTPRAVTSDVDGYIWVTDSKGDRPRVQVFDHDGKFLRIFGEKGNMPGQILRGHGMDFNYEKEFYIVDVDNFRVTVYDYSGKYLFHWGEVGVLPGQLNAPHGLYIDPSGDIFVSGYYGPTQKFDGKGNYLFTFAHGDPPDGPVFFHTIAGDQWGNVFLMVRNKEGYAGQIQKQEGKALSILKYNNNGDYITGWALEQPDHQESWAVIGDDGIVYSIFKGSKAVGVQTFEPQ